MVAFVKRIERIETKMIPFSASNASKKVKKNRTC